MFFIGIFGTGSKLVPAGQIFHIACPVCGREVTMEVQHSYSYLHAFFLPIWKYGVSFPCVCPSCASVFSLSPDAGRLLLRGAQPKLTPESLTLLQANRSAGCPSCGAPRLPDSLFCSRCGAKL